MKATDTLNAWKAYAQEHSTAGADNVFTHDGVSYSFDAKPRKLANGALQGRCYAQRRGQAPVDIGGFKIAADGSVVSLPLPRLSTMPSAAAMAAHANDCPPEELV